jgi:hypothetical protein
MIKAERHSLIHDLSTWNAVTIAMASPSDHNIKGKQIISFPLMYLLPGKSFPVFAQLSLHFVPRDKKQPLEAWN